MVGHHTSISALRFPERHSQQCSHKMAHGRPNGFNFNVHALVYTGEDVKFLQRLDTGIRHNSAALENGCLERVRLKCVELPTP